MIKHLTDKTGWKWTFYRKASLKRCGVGDRVGLRRRLRLHWREKIKELQARPERMSGKRPPPPPPLHSRQGWTRSLNLPSYLHSGRGARAGRPRPGEARSAGRRWGAVTSVRGGLASSLRRTGEGGARARRHRCTALRQSRAGPAVSAHLCSGRGWHCDCKF